MLMSHIQAETPQELMLLVTPIPSKEYEGDYEEYLRTFYAKEALFPKIDYIVRNIHKILSSPTVQASNFDWGPYIVHAVKVSLANGGYFVEAAKVFQEYTRDYMKWIQEWDFGNDRNELEYKDTILFIALETFVQFRAHGKVDTEVLSIWSYISTDALSDAVFFPFDYLNIAPDNSEDHVSERYKFHSPLPNDNESDFIEVYVNMVKLFKKTDMTERKYHEHILACLKMIYDHLSYFNLENNSKFLLYIEKLQAMIKQSSIPGEIFYLYRLFCEAKMQGEDSGFEQLQLNKEQIKRFKEAFDCSFDWCISNNFREPLKVFWNELYFGENDSNFTIIKHAYQKCFKIDSSLANDIIDRNVHLRTLFERKEYKIISECYMRGLANRKMFYFEVAYSLSECGYHQEAKQVYEKAIEEGDQSSSIYNNLGVIYSNIEKNDEKARECYVKALELDPKDKTAKGNLDIINKKLKEKKEKPKKLTESYFKITNKWHKKLLFTIYKFGERPISIEDLAEATNQKESYVEKNLNELLRMEILQSENGTYKIEPTVQKLVADFIDPKLERQIIKADRMNLYRPIFFHESEISLYRVLLELFPQHFVFPNISLKTIVDIEKLKELISSEHMNYLFMAHVDFAIISTSTYVPVIAIEKDSNYHDTELAAKKDKMKNEIFKMSGIPLIRIRFNKGMTAEKLKQEIRSATKEMILDIQKDEIGNNRLLEEIDVRNFGVSIHSDIDLDLLQDVWNRIVGEGIAKKSKVLDVKNNEEFHVSISSDLETIIDFSREQITMQIKKAIPTINQLVISYY
ncbi:DUF2726 domain-containing protein [Brevibacillus sp. NPDC058079]|uniref:DUF2726 domain-containing protein n=1 Tax=Brevibacillus sp. NPDC058079 TaxID=3346330 RepID=UPI0036F09570